MEKNRREFIKLGTLAATGLMLPLYSCGTKNSSNTESANDSTPPASTTEEKVALSAFGIQLYSVKDEIAKDPKGVLKQLGIHGFNQIESFEGEQGMFWGMSNKEFKTYVEDQGMKVIASHCNTEENFEAKAEQAAEIGMKYLISPWVGPQKTADDYKRIAAHFNELGEICKKNDLRFAYHNHDYSFKETGDGQVPHKIFLENTDKDLVDFEMDIYWVVAAGADPKQYLQDYPGRFRLCHIKDRVQKGDTAGEFETGNLGKGNIDFADILKTAKENGMEYYFFEQENFAQNKPMESAKLAAEYLKSFKM